MRDIASAVSLLYRKNRWIMAGKRIRIILAADGERQFTQALSNARKESGLLTSELKKLDTEYKGNVNSLDYLQKKQDNLSKQTEVYQKRIEASKKGLANAQEVSRNAAKRYDELRESLANAKKAQEELEKSGQSGTKEQKKQTQEVENLQKALDKQGLECQKCEGKITDWNKKITDAETDLKKKNQALEKNTKLLKEAENATNNCATSIDGYGKATSVTIETVKKFSQSLMEGLAGGIAEKGLDVATDAATKAAEAVKDSMYDLSSASSELQATTGASATAMTKYNAVMKQIKGNNFGESYSDVAEAMGVVIQTMGELNDTDLQNITESAMTLSDTFGYDYQEQLRAVDMLMKQFGVTGTEAFNLIVQGTQQGLNKNGDLLDSINEYAVHYAQMGTTAEEFFNSLANGTDAGTFSVDKLGDAYKEFGIRVKDTATSTDEAYELLGLNADQMRAAFAEGGESAAHATDTVLDALMSMDDKVKQNQAGVDLFGTMWEDLGIEGVKALTNLEGEISATKNAMEDLKKVRYSDLESAVSGLGAALQEEIVTPIADKALPIVTGLFETATGVIEGIGEAINPQKTEIEQLVTDIKIANDEIKGIMDGAADTMTNAEEEAAKLEILGTQLMNLNVIEEKSAGQKLQLKSVVEQLGQQIPEIAEAYDEEAGKIELSDLQIQNLIAHTKDLMIAQAAQTALQETVNALMQAQVEYEKAQGATEAAKEKLSVYEEEKELLLNLQNEYDRYNQAMSNAQSAEEVEEIEKTFMNAEKAGQAYIDFWKVALDSGRVTLEEYEAAMENCGVEQFGNRLVKNENDISKWSKTVSDAEKETQKAGEQLENCEEDYEDYSDAVDKATEALENSTNAVAENDSATDANAARQEQLAMRQRDVAESTEEEKTGIEGLTEALAENATAADRAAEAQKNAAQSVSDAYHGYVDEIKADLQDKISLFDKFDASSGGEDQTVETMTENLNSQIEAYQEYEKNLAEVRDHVGKEIAPEFMQYLEEMGLEGSNTLKHILATFEDGDAEKIKEMSDKWVEAMDVSEGIAETQAANKLAYEMSIKEFGSTDADFSALSSSIDTAVSKAAEGWANLPEKTKTALDEVIQTAQDCGIQIPEGLAAGIESGEISPEEAFGQLTGAIQGSFDGLAEIAKELGIQVPEGLQEGIDAGGQSAVDAFDQMFNAIAAGTDTAALTQKGQEAGESFSSGIENSTEAAGTAATGMTDAAVAALEQAAPQFQQAGADSAANYTKAFQTAISQASQSAGALASAARNAVAAYRNSFYNTGYNLSAGIASGIRSGQSSVISAAIDVATAALRETKKTLGIASPSRKFKKEVGEQISTGMAFGISDKASLAGKAATKMSNDVYTKATSWLSKYKKKQKVSLEEEKWYWEQVVKHTKKGTTAYKNAVKKVDQIATTQDLISLGLSADVAKKATSNFGVSKTTGSGKNKKNKDSETYYSEIYTAAQKYLSNQQILNDWSLQQELAYWEAVKNNLKKGTQGWYDATKQIKTLQADIAEAEANAAEEKIKTQASVQRDLLDKYKVYYKVSAKAEMDYWNLARQQFKTGTDERIEADQKYLEACQDYYDQRKELDEEYAENSKQINDDLADSVKELQDAYKDAVASRKQDILSSMNLFESWDATGYDGDTLLYNLKTQVAGLALWEQQLEELGKKGLSDALMEELSAMGPDAAANIYSLNQMTAEQLAEYNKLWTQKNDLANSQAIKDNAGLLAETNKEITNLRTEAQSELNALNADYRAALQELNTGISSELKNLVNKAGTIGEDAVSGLISGIGKAVTSVETYNSTTQVVDTISSQLDKLKEEGKTIGANALDGLLAAMQDSTKINTASQQVIQSIKRAMEEEAEIHSPSRLFRRETGPQIPAGLALGMEDGTQQAVRSAQEMMQETLAAAHGELGKQQATLQTQVESLSYSGIARLNRLTEQTPQAAPVVNIDNSTLATLLGTLINTVNGLAEKIDSQQLVLDTGVVAAQMQPLISQESAAITVRRNRGRY